MRWTVHSERQIYRDQWLDVRSADVELPDGRHLDHRLIHTQEGAGAVVVAGEKVLLMWRHRFITDTWSWEIPIGGIDDGETPAQAAAREVEEETGWRPGPMRPLLYTEPSPGLMTSRHHIYRADSAEHIGDPEDGFESERIEWIPISDLKGLIDKRDITSGTTLAAVLYLLAGA